jgi:hypothetical protein
MNRFSLNDKKFCEPIIGLRPVKAPEFVQIKSPLGEASQRSIQGFQEMCLRHMSGRMVVKYALKANIAMVIRFRRFRSKAVMASKINRPV